MAMIFVGAFLAVTTTVALLYMYGCVRTAYHYGNQDDMIFVAIAGMWLGVIVGQVLRWL